MCKAKHGTENISVLNTGMKKYESFPLKKGQIATNDISGSEERTKWQKKKY